MVLRRILLRAALSALAAVAAAGSAMAAEGTRDPAAIPDLPVADGTGSGQHSIPDLPVAHPTEPGGGVRDLPVAHPTESRGGIGDLPVTDGTRASPPHGRSRHGIAAAETPPRSHESRGGSGRAPTAAAKPPPAIAAQPSSTDFATGGRPAAVPEPARAAARAPAPPAHVAEAKSKPRPTTDARAASGRRRDSGGGSSLFGKEENQGDGADEDASDDFEKSLAEAQDKPYRIETLPAAQLTLTPPELPDLTPYTVAALMAKVQPKPAGNAGIGPMLGETVFKGFTGGDERLREWALRQSSLPKVIYIQGGYMRPQDLARILPKSVFEETSKGVFVARLPIDIRPGSTLHIDNSVKEFRLSQDHGAFLINEGRLFVTGTRLLAWNEKAGKPAWFKDKHEFRPFITSWGGSETWIAESTIAHLGYAASKSYGIAITQFSPVLAPILNRPNPHGWILNSEFHDLWYGFYCYEAEDVVVRGNTYHDNIKYGIDPHDRSERLIIAENTVYGTKEKHGIIVSREVNNSWILNNKSYENELSGIVIDRNSVSNVIAYNQIYRNKADGITIYESPQTLIWRNLSTGNQRHGIRIRNSTDVRIYENVALGNALAGVYGHIKDLKETGRNLRLDPFAERISMVIVGGQLVSNGSGPVSIDQPLSLEMYDVDLRTPQRELGINFSGVLGQYQQEVLDILVRQKQAVVIKPATVVGDARK